MIDEQKELRGKSIAWAGIVVAKDTLNHQFVIRCTDGTVCTVASWQNEGDPVEMSAAISHEDGSAPPHR